MRTAGKMILSIALTYLVLLGIVAVARADHCDPRTPDIYLQTSCHIQSVAGSLDLDSHPIIYRYAAASWFGLDPAQLPRWVPDLSLAGQCMAFPPCVRYDPFDASVAAVPLFPGTTVPWLPQGTVLRVRGLWWPPDPYYGYRWVDVVVQDTCPGCTGLDVGQPWVDLSPAAFTLLAPLPQGRINTTIEILERRH